MHRTQISLEESQYNTLRQYSQKSNRSISSIIRELLDTHLPAEIANDNATPLKSLKGIVSGKGKTKGKDHNDILYTHEKRWNEQ